MNDDKELTAIFAPDHLLGNQQANLQVISLKIEGEKIPLNIPVSHYIAESNKHDVTAFIQNTGLLKGEGIVELTIKNNMENLELYENQSISLVGYSGQNVTFTDVTGKLKEETHTV